MLYAFMLGLSGAAVGGFLLGVYLDPIVNALNRAVEPQAARAGA